MVIFFTLCGRMGISKLCDENDEWGMKFMDFALCVVKKVELTCGDDRCITIYNVLRKDHQLPNCVR